MPHYLFQFASRGGEQVPDPHGLELEDLRAAHHHAMKLIRRTALFTCRRWNAREWSVQVVDIEHGGSVLTVLFPVAEHDNCLRDTPADEPTRDAADRLGGGCNQTWIQTRL
jgi:hypothetical protein